MTYKEHDAINLLVRRHLIPLMVDRAQMEKRYGVKMTETEWLGFCFGGCGNQEDEIWDHEVEAFEEALARHARHWLQHNRGVDGKESGK